jgi:hypothetical protein
MSKKHDQYGVAAIADAIVELVNACNGPVTLAYLAKNVPGFSAQVGEPSYDWVTFDSNDESVIWIGMTKNGIEALRAVVLNSKVAICPMTLRANRIQGYVPLARNWVPIGLTSRAAANFTTCKLLISASEPVLRQLESDPRATLCGAQRL